jgi:micrococcal nuclease
MVSSTGAGTRVVRSITGKDDVMLRALPLLLVLALPASMAAQDGAFQPGDRCRIRRVVDGDTFSCGDGRKVRLIGLDSPELGQGRLGLAARRALERLVPAGSSVRLEFDIQPIDRYGRVLAYVWAGDTLVNEALVRAGWAVLYTVPPDVKYADRLRRAQNEARAARAGLWSENAFEYLPSDFRRGRCAR